MHKQVNNMHTNLFLVVLLFLACDLFGQSPVINSFTPIAGPVGTAR